jgi:hypothetical protein
MAETIFQVTQFGKGFHGPGQPSLEKALEILRKKLGKLIGPYQFRGGPKRTFELSGHRAACDRAAQDRARRGGISPHHIRQELRGQGALQARRRWPARRM